MGMQVAAYGGNRQFPEYADLSADDRHGRLNFMLPSNEYDEFGNKKPNVMTMIPNLREAGAISAPLIYLLEKLDANPTVRGLLPEGMRSGAQVQDDFGMFLKGWGSMANPMSSIMSTSGYLQAPIHYVHQFVEMTLNYDTYYDRPIVPPHLATRPASEQFDEFTSETAIRVGGLLGLSPMHIDHLFRNGAMFDVFAAADAAIFYADGGDPIIRSHAAVLAEMTERYEGHDIQIQTRQYLAQFSPEMQKKIKEAKMRLIDPDIPFVTSAKNKFIQKKGGNLYRNALDIAEEKTGASAKQTREVNIRTSQYWEDILSPILYDLDQRFEKYQIDASSSDNATGISPETWLNQRRMQFRENEAFLWGLSTEFSEAIQFREGADRSKWNEAVYTVGGMFPVGSDGARVSAGQFYSMALDTIPMYDALTGEMETFPGAGHQTYFTPDWYRLFKDQEEFLSGLSEADRKDIDEWDASNDSKIEKQWKADHELMLPYITAKDHILDFIANEGQGSDLNDKSPRELLRIYESKNPTDRVLWKEVNREANSYKIYSRKLDKIITVNIIDEIERLTEDRRKDSRNNMAREQALLFWGFVTSPSLEETRDPLLTRENIRQFR